MAQRLIPLMGGSRVLRAALAAMALAVPIGCARPGPGERLRAALVRCTRERDLTGVLPLPPAKEQLSPRQQGEVRAVMSCAGRRLGAPRSRFQCDPQSFVCWRSDTRGFGHEVDVEVLAIIRTATETT